MLVDEEAHPVFWAHVSMLKGDLKCIDLLLRHDKKWKYVINQPGTAFPIIPVNNITRFLTGFKGPCDAVLHSSSSSTATDRSLKNCSLDSIHSRNDARFNMRYHFKFELR